MTAKAYDYYINVSNPFIDKNGDYSGANDSKIRRVMNARAKCLLCSSIILFALVVATITLMALAPWESPKKPRNYWMPDFISHSKLGNYSSAAVSTDAAPCAKIGKETLLKGGTAVDAAIASLVCMGAVNPQSSGLGGGFLMLYYNRTAQRAFYIDAREVAPLDAEENMFEGNATLSQFGGLAIAVPGELAGYYTAHSNYGVLAWPDLFTPTIRLCREGITVTKHLGRALADKREFIMQNEALRNIFVDQKTGDVYKVNDVIKRPDLANTLETIARENVGSLNSLYGESNLTTHFLQDLKNAGSKIKEIDLSSYVTKSRWPIKKRLRDGMFLYSVSPPGSGPILALTLNVLDGYSDLNPNITSSKEQTVLTLHRMIETFKFAYAHRQELEDDGSEKMRRYVRSLLSKSYAEKIRQKISNNRTLDAKDYGLISSMDENHGTAHVSIVAANGDAVSVTSSINLYFGSLVVSPSTGIILNNGMDDFSLPNVTNYFGLPPTKKNRISPKKRPMSSMTPIIVVNAEGDVRLVIGGNGGSHIISSVVQATLRNLWLKENIKRCIDAPRFHHQLYPNLIDYEKGFLEEILEELRKMGHNTRMMRGIGGVVMAISSEDGCLYANSDYRKDGGVDGF